tara:strand:+ start:1834 stop:2295 length:462 start_codon:yes stop_codon:yes gene_type:complete
MATIIKLKRSTSASSVPGVSDLQDGEVAVNVIDKKIYVRNGGSIVEVANNTAAQGSTNLSSVGSSIIPDTDGVYDIGSLSNTFRDIFVGKSIKTKCNVFTSSAGLGSAAAQFAFRVKVDEPIFDEVFTGSSGLASKAITLITDFNDSNPAFLF